MASSVGIVVIGRNEAPRLGKALRSVQASACPAVYVDSASSDGSREIAAAFPFEVIEIDPSLPLSAARSRNEGVAALMRRYPQLRYVQFLDGDCELAPGWIDLAVAFLEAHPDQGAVIGQVREADPGRSIYNRLCDLEWASPAGPVSDFGVFGGLSCVRVEVFRALGGFNANVIAGEDSEFAVRMSLAGHAVTKLAEPMAVHDAAMTRFSQWWRRSVRAGHAIAQRAALNGRPPVMDCVRPRRSAWFWAGLLPALIIVAMIVIHPLCVVLFPAAYGLLALRVYRARRRVGSPPAAAAMYAVSIVLAKFAHCLGMLRYQRSAAQQRFGLIEYK